MIISSLLILLGFILLIKGADWLVAGSSALAKKHKVSDLVIGLTIVAFGTSAPELIVNSVAAFENLPGIVMGNVIGSNLFNLFVILGLVGVIRPIVVQSETVWREIPYSLLAALVLLFLANGPFLFGERLITRWDGLIMLVLFSLFLFLILRKSSGEDIPGMKLNQMSSGKTWLLIAVGLGGLILGGKLVVDNSVEMARSFGLSEKIIGITILAAGTSLPELVTSVMAAIRGKSDIAIGNIIGSNIFNILLILSVSSLIRPIQFNTAFNSEILLLSGGTLLLFLAMFSGRMKRLDRWEAGVFLIAYAVYMFLMISSSGSQGES